MEVSLIHCLGENHLIRNVYTEVLTRMEEKHLLCSKCSYFHVSLFEQLILITLTD